MGRLHVSSMAGLMMTSLKWAYATHWVIQVCCGQSPCPHGRPLLICASTRRHSHTHRQVWLRCDYTKAFDCVDQNKLFISVAQLCPGLCDPMDCSTQGFHVLYYLPEFAQNDSLNDAIQPSHPLPSPFPPAFNLSQHQHLFQ